MNANALHPGHDYAFVTFPRKNRRFRPEAKRVRVLHVYKLDDQWSTKRRTYVEVVPLTDDGERQIDHTGKDLPLKTITARQLYTTWEEHVVEQRKYRQETEERRKYQEKLDREAEQRRREYEEQINRERLTQERKKERMLDLLEDAGIPREIVRIGTYDITINKAQWERRLNEQNSDQRAGQESVSNTNNN